jgi:phospholipid/cholesterol/gamma-HCH transport system permease protein
MSTASPQSMLQQLGRTSWSALGDLGNLARFTLRMFGWLFRRGTRWRLLAPQFYEVGVRSIPVVAITGVFVGMVLAVQIYDQLAGTAAQARAGRLINLSVLREIGPVLAGVMLAGRIGSALAAELGTMKVTEQIDALESLGADPIRYLVVPRFLACFMLIPFLTVYCDALGILGGYAVVVGGFGA